MYPTDPSISSYGSNPSTPVNSPPPLTSQTSANPLSMHQGNNSGNNWQQIPIAGPANQQPMNSLQNPIYPSELVPRGLHMVSSYYILLH